MEDIKKIVVLGGSFNPPTMAHLRLLLGAVDELGADKGIFVPSSDEYVRNKMAGTKESDFVLSESVRAEMLSVMATEDLRLCVENVEFGKKATGEHKWRTIDTLNALSAEYPDSEICFLMGGDKLDVLPRWTRIGEILENYRIIAVKRDGDDPERDIASNEFLSRNRDRFYIMDAPDGMEGVSSSAVRRCVRGDDSAAARDMCHPDVWLLLRDVLERNTGEICGFFGEYRFLSNFYEAPVTYRGLKYQSNEAAFQAQKCMNEAEKQRFTALSPSEAKKLGQEVELRPDWEKVKLGIMEKIVRAKFTQNESLAVKLINTGEKVLIEGNTWNDLFWGVDMATREGKNRLGRILMKIRSELSKNVLG